MTGTAAGALAGVVATLGMDIGAAIGRRARWIRGFNPPWLGRWVVHLFRGKLAHKNIGKTRQVKLEMLVALLAHYCIGAALGAVYLKLVAMLNLPLRNIWPAMVFGLGSSVLPWFVLFPAFGFGFYGEDAPRKLQLFRTSLYNHAVYGLVLGLFWVISAQIALGRTRF